MSTDKTPATLATAKHGGCVQLETVPYDRARELIGDAYNAGTHGIGYSQQMMELHDAVFAAQPSPGGQGDARRCAEHCQNGRADVCLASQRDGIICPEDSCDIDDGIRHNRVAARQPVGEHPMEMRICELRHVSLKPNRPYVFTVDANCAKCRADAAYALEHADAPPAQAVDLGQFRALAEFGEGFAFSAEKRPHSMVIYAQSQHLLALIDGKAVGK